MGSSNDRRVAARHPDGHGIDSDHLLAVVLDVLAEADDAELFGSAELFRTVRPIVDPVPCLEDVSEMLTLLALPMLGGVIAVGEGTYRVGATPDIVRGRLGRLAQATRALDDEELADRY